MLQSSKTRLFVAGFYLLSPIFTKSIGYANGSEKSSKWLGYVRLGQFLL
jgi:hypothetical protein